MRIDSGLNGLKFSGCQRMLGTQLVAFPIERSDRRRASSFEGGTHRADAPLGTFVERTNRGTGLLDHLSRFGPGSIDLLPGNGFGIEHARNRSIHVGHIGHVGHIHSMAGGGRMRRQHGGLACSIGRRAPVRDARHAQGAGSRTEVEESALPLSIRRVHLRLLNPAMHAWVTDTGVHTGLDSASARAGRRSMYINPALYRFTPASER